MLKSHKPFSIQKAAKKDIPAISELTRQNSKLMLFRSARDIEKILKNFFVAVDAVGEIAGCCGFKIYPGGDAEIISLVVKKKYRGQGIGGKLIKTVTRWALKRKNVKRVMTLTIPPVISLFKKNNFTEAGVQLFHEKILEDCRKCPRNKLGKNKKYLCNEIALVFVGR